MFQTIKTIAMKIRTARIMQRIDAEIYRLETIAQNTARTIAATNRVMEAIEDGSMRS